MSKTQKMELVIGLVIAAQTAKEGGLNRHEATNAIRDAVHNCELAVSNKTIRDAVAIVYREEAK